MTRKLLKKPATLSLAVTALQVIRSRGWWLEWRANNLPCNKHLSAGCIETEVITTSIDMTTTASVSRQKTSPQKKSIWRYLQQKG